MGKECLVDKGTVHFIYVAMNAPIKPFEIWTLLLKILSIVSILSMYLYATWTKCVVQHKTTKFALSKEEIGGSILEK